MKYLIVAFIVTCLIRIVTSGVLPHLIIENDSEDYYVVGKSIIEHPSIATIINPLRTPVYPLFVGGVMRIMVDKIPTLGTVEFFQHADLIALLQMLYGITASIAWYFLLARMGLSKRSALICYILCAINVSALIWERKLMSEGVSVSWMLIQTYLYIEAYHHRKLNNLLLFGGHSCVGFLLRPAFAPIPILMLLSMVMLSKRPLWRWVSIIFLITCTMMPLAYTKINRIYHNYSGITYFSTVNLLGIIMQSNIPITSGSGYDRLYSHLYTYLSQGNDTYVYRFILAYDRNMFTDNSKLVEMQGFVGNVIRNNILQYITVSFRAIPHVLFSQAPHAISSDTNIVYVYIFRYLEILSDYIRMSMIISIPLWIYHAGVLIHRRSSELVPLFILGTIGLSQVIIIAFFAYESDPVYKRLIAPVEYHLVTYLYISFMLCVRTFNNYRRHIKMNT